MKEVRLEHSSLAACVTRAQRERVVITKKGKPVALLLGITQQHGSALPVDPAFWQMIEARRKQATITRSELERRLKGR